MSAVRHDAGVAAFSHALSQDGGLRQVELSRRLDLSKWAVRRRLRSLDRMGLLVVQDRRYSLSRPWDSRDFQKQPKNRCASEAVKQGVLAHLQMCGRPRFIQEVAAALELPVKKASRALNALTRDGFVERARVRVVVGCTCRSRPVFIAKRGGV